MATHAVADPFKAGVLLRDAWDLVRRHPLHLALPLVLLALLTTGGRGDGGDKEGWAMAGPEQLPGYAIVAMVLAGIVLLAVLVAVLILLLILSAAVMLTTTRMAFAAARGEPMPPLLEAFREARPRVLTASLALLLGLLLVVVGLILLVVPGIVVMGALLPLFAVLLRESRGATGSIGRAWGLSRPHLLPLFLVALAGVGVVLLAGIALSWIPLVGAALAAIVSGTVQAVWIAVGALYYERQTAYVPSGAAAPPPPMQV